MTEIDEAELADLRAKAERYDKGVKLIQDIHRIYAEFERPPGEQEPGDGFEIRVSAYRNALDFLAAKHG